MAIGETESMKKPENDGDQEAILYRDLPSTQAFVLLVSISIVALCGIVYELIIGTVSSYLLGNSIYQFSLTIGFFMFAMGIGSYLSKFLVGNLIKNFIYVEIVLAVVGGVCSLALFFAFPFSPGLYRTIMFGFILAIGTLVGLEIPLLTRILVPRSGTRRSIANVMSLDYIGALVGSVAFPLMLLPGLGLLRSSFAIGLINIFVAFLSVIFLRQYLPDVRRILIVVAGAFLLLAGLTLAGDRLTSFAQQHLFFDKIIWQKQTPYQKLVVTRDWQRKDLRLFIDGHIQFSQMDEHRYHEALVHPVMNLSGKAENILVMGGGDGLAVRELLKYANIKHIDLVDLDPEMTALGQQFAPMVRLNKESLHDPRVHIFNEDAFIFIRRKGRLYDRVILDFPDPHNEAIAKLYSLEFYTMLSRRMSQNGAVVTQSSSPFFARKTFWAIRATLEKVFAGSQSYQIAVPAFGLWGFNIARKNQSLAVDNIEVKTRFISNSTYEAALVFSKDISRPAGLIANSIFEPILYQFYLNDMQGEKSALGEVF